MSSSRCWDLFKGSSISEILQRRFFGFGCGNAQDSPDGAGRDESRDEPEETDSGQVLKKVEREF